MSFVQLFISLGTGPESELNPRESFSSDMRSQREANGNFPDRPRRERSISVTEPLELQVTPEKVQRPPAPEELHESKTPGFESRRDDLMLSRTWRSEEETMEKRETTREKKKKNPKLRDDGDMSLCVLASRWKEALFFFTSDWRERERGGARKCVAALKQSCYLLLTIKYSNLAYLVNFFISFISSSLLYILLIMTFIILYGAADLNNFD